jgi:diaminohydroxyphosphoribosylaminopyrimidine deaminase/5-amino-6-(5-phosphoribosylamino)uracil reductase
MTLDGKLAARSGDSRWISCEASRAIVHQLRGRVDAIMVGRNTAALDDPLLTARPGGHRVAARVVLDSSASLSSDSQLVRTARQVPLIVGAADSASAQDRQRLAAAGCEVVVCPGAGPSERLDWLLDELGHRRMTNVLVEGGGRLLGSLFDAHHIDEVHVFIAPKLLGGGDAVTPIAATGVDRLANAVHLADPRIDRSGSDIYVHGRVAGR